MADKPQGIQRNGYVSVNQTAEDQQWSGSMVITDSGGQTCTADNPELPSVIGYVDDDPTVHD